VRHSAGPPGQTLIVRVALERGLCRLEVEDAGDGGEVVRRPPDMKHGGGLGLNIVHTLSERWGVERAVNGGTRVWAYVLQAPLAADDLPRSREAPNVTAQV